MAYVVLLSESAKAELSLIKKSGDKVTLKKFLLFPFDPIMETSDISHNMKSGCP